MHKAIYRGPITPFIGGAHLFLPSSYGSTIPVVFDEQTGKKAWNEGRHFLLFWLYYATCNDVSLKYLCTEGVYIYIYINKREGWIFR